MAELRAYAQIDMSPVDTGGGTWQTFYADEQVLVSGSEDGYALAFYIGAFTYPDGLWRGSIYSIEVYYGGELGYLYSDIDVGTRYATDETTLRQTFAKTFAADDALFGSVYDDRLDGYAGDDRVRGDRGDDALRGMAGRDALYGGSGRDILRGGADDDALYGGAGNDAIRGGAQNDRLSGGSGRDAFVFFAEDGRDRIIDFENGDDVLRIRDGADRYADLQIARSGDDVRIGFADTVVFLEDVSRSQITARDFDFG